MFNDMKMRNLLAAAVELKNDPKLHDLFKSRSKVLEHLAQHDGVKSTTTTVQKKLLAMTIWRNWLNTEFPVTARNVADVNESDVFNFLDELKSKNPDKEIRPGVLSKYGISAPTRKKLLEKWVELRKTTAPPRHHHGLARCETYEEMCDVIVASIEKMTTSAHFATLDEYNRVRERLHICFDKIDESVLVNRMFIEENETADQLIAKVSAEIEQGMADLAHKEGILALAKKKKGLVSK